jgi:hypothetical protein
LPLIDHHVKRRVLFCESPECRKLHAVLLRKLAEDLAGRNHFKPVPFCKVP